MSVSERRFPASHSCSTSWAATRIVYLSGDSPQATAPKRSLVHGGPVYLSGDSPQATAVRRWGRPAREVYLSDDSPQATAASVVIAHSRQVYLSGDSPQATARVRSGNTCCRSVSERRFPASHSAGLRRRRRASVVYLSGDSPQATALCSSSVHARRQCI